MRQQAKELAKVGLLSVSEAAKRGRVSTRTVYVWIESGKLETIPVGDHVYVRESSLARHLGREASQFLGLTYPEK